LSQTAAATINLPAAAHLPERGGAGQTEPLLARFHGVRNFTVELCRTLEPEDCVVQSIPDVSPTKWHLAHTTWFFETFVLKRWSTGYQPEIPEYAYLFNSYYNAAGDMHRRDLRGLISRPTVKEARRYRSSIDLHIDKLLSSADEKLLAEIEPIMTLGINHEQQHQELLLTDIKHVFAQNPLHPIFRSVQATSSRGPAGTRQETASASFLEFDEAIVQIGHSGSGFCYDNEGPRHRVLVAPFALASRLVTNGEFIEFIEAGGYARPEFWLSLGWMTVNEQHWQTPLYWVKRDGEWWNFTLSGFRRVDQSEPVTHISYFEADAYANWAGARLPTEFEWEHAAHDCSIEGNFVETKRFHPQALSTPIPHHQLAQMFGDVWEWTRSAYSPYPGYRAEPGALGEYNGKFMCNQYVLRGGSCATSRSHIRRTYRNFFQPEKRWQFTGIRLARDPS
jgi:ergothioneine biosynthesis protein EgtB